MQKRLRLILIVLAILAVAGIGYSVATKQSASRSASEALLKKIASNDITGSYDSMSPSFIKTVSRDAWKNFMTKEQPKIAKGYTFVKEEKKNDTSSILIYTTKNKPYPYELQVWVEKVEGEWKATYVSTSLKQSTETGTKK